MTMTGATLKTVLGGLGLPPSFFAAQMNVTMRTVVRWFDSDSVSSDVISRLEFLADRTEKEMRKMLRAAPESGTVVLKTYRTDDEYSSDGWPATWHRMLTFRVMKELEAQGRITEVRYR